MREPIISASYATYFLAKHRDSETAVVFRHQKAAEPTRHSPKQPLSTMLKILEDGPPLVEHDGYFVLEIDNKDGSLTEIVGSAEILLMIAALGEAK